MTPSGNIGANGVAIFESVRSPLTPEAEFKSGRPEGAGGWGASLCQSSRDLPASKECLLVQVFYISLLYLLSLLLILYHYYLAFLS